MATPKTMDICLLLMLLISLSKGVPTQKASCLLTQIKVNVSGATPTGTNVFCLPLTEVIYDCQLYNTDGSCSKCPKDSSILVLDPNELPLVRSACVPYSQQTVNCVKYTHYPNNCIKRYECSLCPVKEQVQFTKVSITDNPNKIPKACAQTQIPDCKQYAQYETVDGYKLIGCKTCNQISNPWTGSYLVFGQSTTSVICLDSTTVLGCSKIDVVMGDYKCQQRDCPLTARFKEGPQKIVCASTQISGQIFDQKCRLYKKYQAASSMLECLQCDKRSVLSHYVDNPQQNNIYSYCIPLQSYHKGCAKYVYDRSNAYYHCLECISSQYEFIATDRMFFSYLLQPAPPVKPTYAFGKCLPKGRFKTNDLCLTYHYQFNLIGYQSCYSCKNTNFLPPCYPQKDDYTGGQAEIKLSDGTSLTADQTFFFFIDYCDIYTSIGDIGLYSCTKCIDGYDLITSRTYRFIDIQICIDPTKKVPNCLTYYHLDLRECLEYDYIENCTVSPASPICTKVVTNGFTQVCVSCPVGYTLKNNGCVKAVMYCAQLTMSGQCLACTKQNKFALVNNTCVERPVNCKIPTVNGLCSVCNDGFMLGSQLKCIVSNFKNCPEGYFPNEKKACIEGQIKNCKKYTIEGNCAQCKPNYLLSDDLKACISTDPSDKWSHLPPCNAPAKGLISLRDYLGNCLEIDANCLYYVESNGKCIVCKNNLFAHTDGRCYKLYFEDGGF